MKALIATAPRAETGLVSSWAKCLILGKGNNAQAERVAEGLKAPAAVISAIKAPISSHWTGDPDVEGLDNSRRILTSFSPFLRSSSLFFRLWEEGLTRVPLRQRISLISAVATGFVAAEGAAIPVSRMEVEGAGIERRKSNALVILTNELMRSMGTAGDALLARELRRSVSASVDEEFIDIIADDVTPLPSTGTDAIAAARDLAALMTVVNATSESRLIFAMARDVAISAATLTTAGGQFVFPEMSVAGGTMLGVPAMVSDGIEPGRLMLIDATGLCGDAEAITIEVSGDTSIQLETEPDGNSVTPAATELVSMFQTNSSAVMATIWFGADRVRSDAVAILDDVEWGEPDGEEG